MLSERTPRNLPSDTEKNPKEIIKVVSLRSGKTLVDPVVKARPEMVSKQAETPVEKNGEEQKGQSNGVKRENEESRHIPAMSFPQKIKREKLDKYFGRFLELLKQLYVDIPFTEVLTQMPAYAKFLKKILSSKRKLEETIVVKLNTHCSSILLNKIPQMCGDQGSFTIPCSLGSEKFDKALCDSGASINLMPLSVFRKLEGDLGVIKSILVSLQLADQTTILREGIIEDILVRVDKFVFPLMLRVGNEKNGILDEKDDEYCSNKASAYSCFKMDVVEELGENYKFDKLAEDTLERYTVTTTGRTTEGAQEGHWMEYS
ncbi:uncharacterized protein [Nicotiana tomentosiformis]|uniref:uncharacterized protein n=1 Tax=Nicotiana tomentosiformis TaxID=4098 RepID=UPI00388C7C03